MRKMRTQPARVDQWNKLVDNLERYRRVHETIPFMLVGTLWMGCKAFYGGPWRALWYLAMEDLRMWIEFRVRTAFLIWVSDYVGWTKVHHYPETEMMFAHSERHGWKCSGSPNCGDEDCIGRSLPNWFKRLTHWHDD